jgi:hypothetical protein
VTKDRSKEKYLASVGLRDDGDETRSELQRLREFEGAGPPRVHDEQTSL